MGHLGGEHLERAPRRGAVLDGLVRRARLRRADAVPAWVKRMPTPDSDTPARSKMAIDRLIARRDVHPPEKALWRMLYETCARCEEILDVSIEELDLAGLRAPVKTKGAVARRRGGRGREDFVLETVYWDAGTARLLPRLIKGRTRGQVFVTRRSPGPGKVVAPRDACPDTGLARADGSSRLGGGGRFRRRPAAAPAPPRKWILPALLATCRSCVTWGVLGCLTAVSPVISLKSVAFPREATHDMRARAGGMSESAGYAMLSPEHEGHRRAQIAHR